MPDPTQPPPEMTRELLARPFVTFTPDDFLPGPAIMRRIAEGQVGWVAVPEGAWSPDRSGGFPIGFEVAPPAAYLTAELARPRWIIPQPSGPPKTRPIGPALTHFLVTLSVSHLLDNARLRGLVTRGDIEEYMMDREEDPLIRLMLQAVDTTPRPPLWLYAESFSPLIVAGRQRLVILPTGAIVLPPRPPEVEPVGTLVLPVWLLGPGRPLADATGRVWPARLAEPLH